MSGERKPLFSARPRLGRIGGWRGFHLTLGRWMLSCHVNGYGHGSQIAANLGGQRAGSTWYGWWSEDGWTAKSQKPLRINSVEIPEDGARVEIPGLTLAYKP